MLIGKRGAATTSISTAAADRITVRGRDLCAELMGALNFTEFFFLLATGRMPTADQSFFLDLALVALAEHGLTPSVQAARMTYAADPAALQGAVAACVLGCGTVVLGAAREAGALLEQVLKAVERLDARGVKHTGVRDRKIFDAIYFEDPLGLLIELSCYKFEPPFGFNHADVLFEAHKLRVAAGDRAIGEVHLADAIELLVARSRPSLSEDRKPKNPYRR